MHLQFLDPDQSCDEGREEVGGLWYMAVIDGV